MLNNMGPKRSSTKRSQKVKEPGNDVSHAVQIHCSICWKLPTILTGSDWHIINAKSLEGTCTCISKKKSGK